jgi:ATP-dependent DNA ligase
LLPRLYSRNANDWTARLHAIAHGADIKAKSFTIDGEAIVLERDGLSRFEELRRREAADTAILYAFDLIERDGEECAIVHSSTAWCAGAAIAQ